MDSTQTRFLAIAIALLLVGGVVALANQDAKPVALPSPGASLVPRSSPLAQRGGIPCPPGPRIAIPAWFPKDLSLPAGAYALDVKLPPASSYDRVALAVPSSLRDFAKHIATKWPEAGWTFTHAEIEFIDAEAQVTKGGRTVAAAFVARAVCDDTYVYMFLTYGSL